MFDFFKDVYYEMNGFDMDKVKEEKRLKREAQENLIFDTKMKIIVGVIGGIMLLCYIATLLFGAVSKNVFLVIKSVILILLTIGTIICVIINNKKVQLAGIVGIVIVVSFTMFL